MHKPKNKLYSIFIMAKANFVSWTHSSRTLIMLLFVVSFCYVISSNHVRMVNELGYRVYWGESLFYLLNEGCNITITSILFLITVSELPQRVGFQHSMLIRSSRAQWLASQILYCLWMVLCMLGLTMISTALFILPGIQTGSGWSDGARIASGLIEPWEALVPEYIRNAFSPFWACLCALLPMFLFWLTMVLVILLFSLYGAPVVGLIMYAISLMATIIFFVESFGGIPMPIYYATLRNITEAWPKEEFVRIAKALVGYVIVLSLLLVGMSLRIKKADLNFLGEQ